MLSMGALDEWKCTTIKVRHADDFVKHFNPHEKQLFWVDDAFGSTQFDWNRTADWNGAFPHVTAAIRCGSKVIFTSRDYIYNSAKEILKESVLPVIKESQVLIHVENLTKEEREQILYNHIRLGQQPKLYKTKLKPFLTAVAHHEKFSPEIARRLGDPFFTKELKVSKRGLDNFVESPLDLLREIIRTMDNGCRAALALVFMRGGTLLSPLKTTEDEEHAISRLGSSIGEAIKGLKFLKGNLLVNSIHEGNYCWRFKHPTVRDAFAAEVASSQDLMDIYLTGTPLDELFTEISCGDVGVKGASIVPLNQYSTVIEKIKSVDIREPNTDYNLRRFLSYRCNKNFLERFIAEFPNYISGLSVENYISSNPNVRILVRLHESGLLPEAERLKAVASIRRLAVEVPDSGFLRENIRKLITTDELSNILLLAKKDLLPNLDYVIGDWRNDYGEHWEPEEYFADLIGTLNEYRKEFKDNQIACEQIDDAIETIEELVKELESEYCQEDFSDSGFSGDYSEASSIDSGIRSIFDDVDL